MSVACSRTVKTRIWRMLNRERYRELQRDNNERQRLRLAGKLIKADSPQDIARWWKERGH